MKYRAVLFSGLAASGCAYHNVDDVYAPKEEYSISVAENVVEGQFEVTLKSNSKKDLCLIVSGDSTH